MKHLSWLDFMLSAGFFMAVTMMFLLLVVMFIIVPLAFVCHLISIIF